MKKKTEKKPPDQAPDNSERFTAIMKNDDKYPLLSVHEFNGVKYQVNAILAHADGIAVEFVRVQ